ncbi:hypothetical protein N9N03_00120 [Chlamydiia bacterium]|jgi:hypothetical protein|nr:hypothetical protein [Chlamydiia bacterium]
MFDLFNQKKKPTKNDFDKINAKIDDSLIKLRLLIERSENQLDNKDHVIELSSDLTKIVDDYESSIDML